jgi:histone H3/H4
MSKNISKSSKTLVAEKIKKMRKKVSKSAQERLAVILDDLAEHVLHGAEKISRFTNRKEIDKDAIDIAAHVNIRSKELKSLKRV